ncbi:MAG: hypothetical protein CMM29_10965 [Rhodospirillaceae bacterium]|nr:hypothetical protein [Rhodospirillaceae bacterium]|tara:strand:+ start:2016 stop:2858 length:843 start_codon:yes stop_codon:yes gene_type:complete
MSSVQITHDANLNFLIEQREKEGPRETAFGTSGRGSMAGSCSRRMSFEALQVEETDPITETTLLAFHIGTALHELTQLAMVDQWSMRTEVAVDLRPLGYPISGHADGVYNPYPQSSTTAIWELKTKTGFGFREAVNSGHPERHEVAQAAMYGLAVSNCQYVHLVYLAKDTTYGRNAVKAGQTVEWFLDMDEPVPGCDGMTPRQIGTAEATRIGAIMHETFEDRMLPERFIPDYGIVEMVPYPDSKDQPWRCRYCQFNALCATLPTGQIRLDDILLKTKGD